MTVRNPQGVIRAELRHGGKRPQHTSFLSTKHRVLGGSARGAAGGRGGRGARLSNARLFFPASAGLRLCVPLSPLAGPKKVQAAGNAVPEDAALSVSTRASAASGGASHSRLLRLEAARLKPAPVPGSFRQKQGVPDRFMAPA